MRARRFPSIWCSVVFLQLRLAAELQSADTEPAAIAVNGGAESDLVNLSLDELLQVEVTSVSKKEERLFQAPAAIHVITQEDIRRSGLKTLPEVLRLAPGLEVARIDSSKWAISPRGFNGRYANKLLVLIDGRTVYTPIFSGVFWNQQSLLLEDVERIEVIRGPGATLWGANAVNGVINVITKDAASTTGGLVSVGGGTEERAFTGARYGSALGKNAFVRVFGSYSKHDNFEDFDGDDTAGSPFGDAGDDEWTSALGGFRLDWRPTSSDHVTVLGDVRGGRSNSRTTVVSYTAPFSRTFTADGEFVNLDLLGRWTHVFSETSDLSVQAYYDFNGLDEEDVLAWNVNTGDIDLHHRFRPLPRQEIVWGVGYRAIQDSIHRSEVLSFAPSTHLLHVVSAFIQDDITLVRDRLRLVLGSKIEHNDYSGFELQPSGRLLWTPSEKSTVWASVSRAVRTPTRVSESSRFDIASSPGLVTSLQGNRGFEAEDLLALELGVRFQPWEFASLDLSAFYNEYNDLVGFQAGTPFFEASPGAPHAVVPIGYENILDAETYGFEVAAQYRLREWWRLAGSISVMQLDSHGGGNDVLGTEAHDEMQVIHHQAQLHSMINLPWKIELDLGLWYADSIAQGGIPSRVRLDLRLGWKPTERLEVSIGAQDLLDGAHPEFPSEVLTNSSEVERSFWGSIRWRF